MEVTRSSSKTGLIIINSGFIIINSGFIIINSGFKTFQKENLYSRREL